MWFDDQILLRCQEQLVCDCWVPERPFIVLGSSNVAEVECRVEQCRVEGVKILRRYGGGGAVVLHSGCLILSVGGWVAHHFRNEHYFRLLNDTVISSLREIAPDVADFTQRGLSDITIGNRKIAGTSLFRSRNYLLYQASLLVEAQADLFAKYLAHPSKEPDYRSRRNHADFVLGLRDRVPTVSTEAVADYFQSRFSQNLRNSLASELIAPQEDQIATILARARVGSQLMTEDNS